MENQEVKQEAEQIELQLADIVNATRIMEYAISKNTFSVKELTEVSPIVVRFQNFIAAVQANQPKQVDEQSDVVEPVEPKE